MQIAGKYQKDYAASLVRLKAARKQFVQELSEIPALRVLPSEANYVMAEIQNGVTSAQLTRELLLRFNLFIKDLGGKVHRDGKQFVRLAVRTEEENHRLTEALKEVLR